MNTKDDLHGGDANMQNTLPYLSTNKHGLLHVIISEITCCKCGRIMRIVGRHYKEDDPVMCPICGTKANLKLTHDNTNP